MSFNEIKNLPGIYQPIKHPKTRIIVNNYNQLFFLSADKNLLILDEDSWKNDKFIIVYETILITFQNNYEDSFQEM